MIIVNGIDKVDTGLLWARLRNSVSPLAEAGSNGVCLISLLRAWSMQIKAITDDFNSLAMQEPYNFFTLRGTKKSPVLIFFRKI